MLLEVSASLLVSSDLLPNSLLLVSSLYVLESSYLWLKSSFFVLKESFFVVENLLMSFRLTNICINKNHWRFELVYQENKMTEISPMENVASVDEADGTLVHSGEVFFQGKKHTLCLLETGLRLLSAHKKTTATDDNVAVLEVSWQDVISAKESAVKKRRAAAKDLEKSPASENILWRLFVLNYIHRDKKNRKLRSRNVTLEATSETAESWVKHIEERRKQGKPQKLLIVINPIGGKGNGHQIFEKQVLPLFALAGVELVVKVTERYQHALEIAKTFDVKSVDGIVVVGGDGMYMETLHGLTLRKQEEEGLNFNDPETQLAPPAVCVGVIPAGTGNAIAMWMNKVVDVKTATLNIIRGEFCQNSIFSVHESGRLVQYFGMQFTNGLFSTIIKRTDELRWMKRARYPYAMLAALFGKKPVFEYEIEILKPPAENKENVRAEGCNSEWTKLGTRQMAFSFTFLCSIVIDQEQLRFKLGGPTYDLIIVDKASVWEYLSLSLEAMQKRPSALEKDFVEVIPGIVGMRFQLVQAPEEGANSSRQQTELYEIAKLLNLDGELVPISEPKFEVRLHPKFLQVYCATEVSQEMSSRVT